MLGFAFLASLLTPPLSVSFSIKMGTGKNLGVLTEIPPFWFAGA
jgi:hypothetical protein